MKTIAALGEIHEDGIKILKKNNFQIKQISDFSKKNLIKNLEYVDAIALRTSNLTKDILKNCKSLKIVSRHGVGYDNVDLKYLNEKKNCSSNNWYIKCCKCCRTCHDNVFDSL